MLIYHPAFDAYHCTFRLIAVLVKHPSIDIDKIRILDFFLAFPNSLNTMKFPRELSWLRQTANQLKNVYRDAANPKKTFADMKHLQLASLGCLSAANLIDSEQLANGVVTRTNAEIPALLFEHATQFLSEDDSIAEKIISNLMLIPTLGADGLKARSGLLEYRYDPI